MQYTAWSVVKSVLLFVSAGVCEIGGGWLVWKWRREGWHWLWFVLGCVVLIAYGLLPTLQDDTSFGRVYAAYGGFFILLALLWGWALDGMRPDMWDIIGASVAVVGACLIIFPPRPVDGAAAGGIGGGGGRAADEGSVAEPVLGTTYAM